jgi:spermidine synthase
MLIWGGQWHPVLQRFLKKIAGVKSGELWAFMGGIGLIVVGVFRTVDRFRGAVAGSVMVMGGAGMVLQMLLLLGFQVVAGFFYLQLSLIIAFFMAGLAAGSGWFDRVRTGFRPGVARKALMIIQGIGSLYPVGIMLFFSALQGEFRTSLSPPAMGWIFSVLSLLAGTVAGAHFSMAVRVLDEQRISLGRVGGGLYAVDLAGAAGGVLLAVFIVIPIFGLMDTLLVLSTVMFISLLTLCGPYRHR